MPLDTILTSARSELAEINEQLREAAAERDMAQAAHDELAPAGEKLSALIEQHQVEMRAMIASAAPDLGTYTDV